MLLTDELSEQLKPHISGLGELLAQSLPPEMITDADRGELYLRGTSSGFVALAIECLKTAQGHSSDAAELYWLTSESWNFQGFIVEASITSRRRQRARLSWKVKGQLLFFASVLLIMGLLLVGLVSSVHYGWTILRHLL